MSTAEIEGFRLSPQQRRAWHLLGDARVSAAVRLGGALDPERLRHAVQQTVEHAEILRTVFQALHGLDLPLQRIVAEAGFREEAPADLETGPPLCFALEPLDGGEQRLQVSLPAVSSDLRS